MTGLERNSGVVRLAAYAPLLANINHVGALCPTNLVIYDNHRCVGRSPVQHLLRPDSHVACEHAQLGRVMLSCTLSCAFQACWFAW